MIKLNNNIVAAKPDEFTDKQRIQNFNFKKKLYSPTKAIKIKFSNELNINIKILKKLKKILNKKFIGAPLNDLKIFFIIDNYNDEILDALKALLISNRKEQVTYLYDKVYKKLAYYWYVKSPCNFKDDLCCKERERKELLKLKYPVKDGCCYGYRISKNPFNKEKHLFPCPYLGEDKHCSVDNISCKFFVCEYLKKKDAIEIDIKKFLLVQVFFNKKEQLIMQFNYFHTKDEIINKLMESDHTPYAIYVWRLKYSIDG